MTRWILKIVMYASCQGVDVGRVDAPIWSQIKHICVSHRTYFSVASMSSAHRTAGGDRPGVDLFAGFFRRSQRDVQVRVEERGEDGRVLI